MTVTFINWMAVLWMASMLAYFVTTATKEDGGTRTCPRRGCRRMPAGQGCNHAAGCDGQQLRQFTPPATRSKR